MERSNDMAATVAIKNQTVLDRNVEIDFLCTKMSKKKTTIREQKDKHAQVKESLNTINIRIGRQSKQINILEHENMKKLDQINHLLEAGEKKTDELARLYRKYNFEVLDKQDEALKNFASWASKLVPTIARVKDVVNQYFNCGLCDTIPNEMMIMRPCEHIFCQQCLSNQGPLRKCPQCNMDKKSAHNTEMLTHLVDSFESIIQEIQHAKNDHKLLEAAFQKVEKAKRAR